MYIFNRKSAKVGAVEEVRMSIKCRSNSNGIIHGHIDWVYFSQTAIYLNALANTVMKLRVT